MKTLLLIFVVGFASSVLAQADKDVYTLVDELPVFGVCDQEETQSKTKNYYKENNINNCSNSNIAKFIAKEVALIEHPLKGKVKTCYVRFVVNEEGKLIDIEVFKSCGDENLDKTAVEIINKMPTWQAGKQGGKAVKVQYILPITF